MLFISSSYFVVAFLHNCCCCCCVFVLWSYIFLLLWLAVMFYGIDILILCESIDTFHNDFGQMRGRERDWFSVIGAWSLLITAWWTSDQQQAGWKGKTFKSECLETRAACGDGGNQAQGRDTGAVNTSSISMLRKFIALRHFVWWWYLFFYLASSV